METEAQSAPPSGRPRTWLLALLGVALLAAVAVSMRDSAEPVAPASNPGRPAQGSSPRDTLDPPDVKLEALKGSQAQPDATDRNPFRFQPKAPPPPPPRPPGFSQNPDPIKPPGPVEPPPPLSPPPIPLKFIGVTEAPGVGKIAALSDCRHTVQGVEGDIVDGRYRIVKIGVESLTIEYLDGKGRTTLRMSGQECVSK